MSLVGVALVVLGARLFRSKAYAIAGGIMLLLHSLIATRLAPHAGVLFPLFCVLHALVFVQMSMLIRARLRPFWFVTLISVPGLFFAAGTMLAFPWAIADALGLTPHLWWVPYALAAIGLWQSLTARNEVRSIVLNDGAHVDGVQRHVSPAAPSDAAPLRIVQITDPAFWVRS